MLSKIFKNKSDKRRFRDRLESCVNTILDLNDRLGEGKIRPDIIEHFKRLKKSFARLDENMVNEKDVSKIEEATNKLLKEIGEIYGEELMKDIYNMPKH